jgi:hypothetical protein
VPQSVHQTIRIELELLGLRQAERWKELLREQHRWQGEQDALRQAEWQALLSSISQLKGASPAVVVPPVRPAPVPAARLPASRPMPAPPSPRPPELPETPRPQPVAADIAKEPNANSATRKSTPCRPIYRAGTSARKKIAGAQGAGAAQYMKRPAARRFFYVQFLLSHTTQAP